MSQPTLPDSTDVVVVGGGIAGTSTAYHLASRGLSVTLLERGAVGGGATGAAVGILSPPVRQPFHEMVRFRGEETARAIWEFAARSVASLGELLRSRGADADAGLDLAGGYVLAEKHTEHLVRGSFLALQLAGLPVHWVGSDEVKEICGGRGFRGGYRLDGGGALSPGPTARALAGSARDEGAAVLEGVAVEEVIRAGRELECRTAAGSIGARHVVYATHVDTRRFVAELAGEITPIRGQGFATAPLPPRFRGSFATHWKMNLWRQAPGGEIVVGGWRHDAFERSYGRDDPEVDPYLQGNLRHWFEATFPELAPLDVQDEWSGVFGWTADYLPLVGPVPERDGEWIISGFSGGGLPFAFEAGRVIADAVTGEEPVAGADLLSPGRFGSHRGKATTRG